MSSTSGLKAGERVNGGTASDTIAIYFQHRALTLRNDHPSLEADGSDITDTRETRHRASKPRGNARKRGAAADSYRNGGRCRDNYWTPFYPHSRRFRAGRRAHPPRPPGPVRPAEASARAGNFQESEISCRTHSIMDDNNTIRRLFTSRR